MTPAEARLAKKRAIPVTPLEPKHTEHCKVLPNRAELLKQLKRGAVCAEVGVAFGDFSRQIVETCQPQKLYLIDAWEGARYAPGLATVRQALKAPIASGQIDILQGLSTDVLATLPDGFLDWVYIDTDHSFATTYAELQLAARKVKPDGVIAGHDFTAGNVVKPVVYGVIQACAKFSVEFGWRYRFITLDTGGYFSFALEKIR